MPPLTVLVFVVGMGSLGAEIAAVRLLAPYFGASTIIWANTIGVVLVALSIGYWLGGRWADRNPTVTGLCRLALLAAIGLAIVPFVGRPLLDVGTKALDQVSAGAFAGSLLAVLVLVAIPVLLLGAVSPWALRIAMTDADKDTAGTIAGRLYATSTAGSLIGTLTAALVWIPLLGTRRTFLIFALLIAAIAVTGLTRRHALAPLVIAVALALPVGTLKDVGDGRVVHEADTEYQYARVIERGDGSRVLELNEGQAFHSLYDPHTVPDRRLLGRAPRAAVRGAGAPRRRDGSPSSATPAARRRAPTATSSRARSSTPSRSTRSSTRSRATGSASSRDRAAHAHRRRAPVAEVDRRPLRRDRRRRLSPALHPVLPDDQGVLRPRAHAAEPRRRPESSTSATPKGSTSSRRS